jgi:UDP-2,3-diacylglucosamine pyrophosphatase LpxH
MGNRNKRIFISDIHMGDNRSMSGKRPYCWFKKNIKPLAKFLDEQRTAPNVKEVVILGDLFDEWVIPTDVTALTSFDNICSNKENKPVIDRLKVLAAGSDVKLAYVPGNHDMGMNTADILQMRGFLESTFPGIRFFCDSRVPLGSYNVGTLAAEHGHRYALFNAPDIRTNSKSFLPLGYFISRVIAYKVSKTGTKEDPRNIFFKFLKDFMVHPDFIEDMFNAIAADADLKADDVINLSGIDGYTGSKKVEEIGMDYKNLIQNWKSTRGNIDVLTAIMGDLANLSYAASFAHFDHFGPKVNIVIFGHTHIPIMDKHDLDPSLNNSPNHNSDEPWRNIYANSGTWVDASKYGCTYVETEEVPEKRRHYVRVITYPANTCSYEGFVEM